MPKRVLSRSAILASLILVANISSAQFSEAAPGSTTQPAQGVSKFITEKSPLWKQYFAAGKAAGKNNDHAAAKKYYLASLDELERAKVDPMTCMLFPALELHILQLYPEDWSQSKLDIQAKEKQQEEAVSVFKKLAKAASYSRYWTGNSRSIAEMADSRYKKSVKQLDETRAQLQSLNTKTKNL